MQQATQQVGFVGCAATGGEEAHFEHPHHHGNVEQEPYGHADRQKGEQEGWEVYKQDTGGTGHHDGAPKQTGRERFFGRCPLVSWKGQQEQEQPRAEQQSKVRTEGVGPAALDLSLIHI